MARIQDVAAAKVVIALILARHAHAQNTDTNTNGDNTSTGGNQQTTNTGTQPQTTTGGNQQTTNSPQTTNTPQTSSATNKATTASTSGKGATTTGKSVSITGIPSSRSTSTPAGTFTGPSDLPTIAGYGIPTQVIPFTAGAPFMQKSNLPEGTVFICVGALLGIMGAAILAWRGLVAWSIHRSVKRANEKPLTTESTKLIRPGYGGVGAGATSLAAQSTLSLDHLSSPARKSQSRSHLASSINAGRNSSLFFSPTAGGAAAGAGLHPSASASYLPSNRSSNYLPSGYYAAPGASAPGSVHMGAGARGYGRQSAYNPSPPSSPGLPPSSRGGMSAGGHGGGSMGGMGMYAQSSSSLNLNVPGSSHPGGRAPSANLEDMLEGYESQPHPPMPERRMR